MRILFGFSLSEWKTKLGNTKVNRTKIFSTISIPMRKGTCLFSSNRIEKFSIDLWHSQLNGWHECQLLPIPLNPQNEQMIGTWPVTINFSTATTTNIEWHFIYIGCATLPFLIRLHYLLSFWVSVSMEIKIFWRGKFHLFNFVFCYKWPLRTDRIIPKH